MKIEISTEANVDIEYILQYSIETFGIIKAEDYMYTLYEKISKLSKFSHIGHFHKFLPNNIRVYNIEKHIVLYKILEEESIVLILRVVHNRVNLAEILEDNQ